MGNAESSPSGAGEKDPFANFPGAALVDALNCGGLDDAEDSPRSNKTNGTPHKALSQFFSRMNTDDFCAMSPVNSDIGANTQFDEDYEEFRPRNTMDEMDSVYNSKQQLSMSQSQQSPHPLQTPSPNTKQKNSSQLFAKAMVSEVTNNPNTMAPAAMAEREKRLLKAQEKARQFQNGGDTSGARPVGAPGGVGQPSVLGSIAHVLKGNVRSSHEGASPMNGGSETGSGLMTSDGNLGSSSVLPPNILSENRAAQEYSNSNGQTPKGGKYTVTIGLSLTRRSSLGHPDTVTRQTAFDFNELQDRDYKYVSSTDSSGWRAGGGERGGPAVENASDDKNNNILSSNQPGTPNAQDNYKIAAPDTVHIPIIHIDAESPQAVDAIVSALASGEVFIPHMAIIPEALSVNGVSPPDLVVRFGTERNEDLPPDEWPNWCLEFMHNQLYEYFQGMGARWMKRPFSITLAKKVRWKTVKHMNRYFAHAERVIDAWREKGPQYLDPQLAYIEGGATPEEVARPHGIYLLRNGVPTNYFAPNFDPPYTTKMTRSLLFNVLGKSWDKKRREWTSQPIPRLVTPSMLVTAMCGCADSQAGGFVATEATLVDTSRGGNSTFLPEEAAIRSASPHDQKKKERKLAATHSPMTSTRGGETPMSEAFGSNNPLHNDRRRNANKALQDRRAEPPEEKDEDDRLDARLDLQMSNSNDHLSEANSTQASKSAISAFSTTLSSKYGRPPTPEEGSSRSNRKSPRFLEDTFDHQRQEEEKENGNPVQGSEAPSTDVYNDSEVMQSSVAATNTTVQHTNMSPKKNKKTREHHMLADEKKEDPILSTMASDEDWLDEVGKPLATPKPDPSVEDGIMASLERESQRHMELIALAQQKSSVKTMLEVTDMDDKKPNSPSCHDPPSEARSTSLTLSSSTNASSSSRHMSIRKNDSGTSGISLEYSVDSTLIGESSVGGSTLNSTVGGSTVGSSLLGHHYTADGSTVMSGMTRETFATAKEGIMQDVLHEGSGSCEESHDESEEEIVPSDEELYAVGWAKALDQSSGSYYYFTLDRSKTVWENPLAHSDEVQSHNEEPLYGANPATAVEI